MSSLGATTDASGSDLGHTWPHAELIDDLRLALTSRALDDREIALQKQGRVFFQISAAGHEVLQLAVARSLRPGYDWVFPYYRDRALALALGVTPLEMLLQAVGSAEDPASGGRQMPCHFGSRRLHIFSTSSPTTSQCLPAVGCAEAAKYIVEHGPFPGCEAQPDEVTVALLGDGACSEGEFWESLSAACTLRLPMLFVVEDNGFAISVPARDQMPAAPSALVKDWPGLGVLEVDGTDYFDARRAISYAVSHIRSGEGPWLVRGKVTRPYSHSAADNQAKYRTAEEIAEEAAHDPILLFSRQLVAMGALGEDDLTALRREIFELVANAARTALSAARPDPARVTEQVVSLPDVGEGPLSPSPGGERIALGAAIRQALGEAMERDPRVRVFGEDVADARPEILDRVEGKGGVFGTTLGLQRKFGHDRCFNTPLAEAGIIGRAVGQAVRGLRPCPEIQFFDYIWTAMQQIRSEATTIRWRSNGMFNCPMVIRAPIGGYLTGGSIWHSQCGESIFAHLPGLLVAFPSRAVDAVGLMRTAFRCEDPVLFLEHKHLLRQHYTEDVFPPEDYVVPFGRARIAREGSNLTIVTYGATVEKSLEVAAELGAEGRSVEVVDLRTLAPWDHETVDASVRKTGRVLVVHEDGLTCGFGAEVAAYIGEHSFEALDAPVMRVGAKDVLVGYEPTLERAILPQTDDIRDACRKLLEY
jgi:2-oxoisovalerate dehydrogenase E1 component